MPEECPLQAFAALEVVSEAELVVLVVFLEEVEELGGCLHHGEGRGHRVVDEDGNAACILSAICRW